MGDKELSQAFVHLSLALLQPAGRAGLLLSSGVLFKHHANSRSFRAVWLNAARLEHVVNFAHVRHVFFTGPYREAQGIAPFICAVFEKSVATLDEKHRFAYWSAKATRIVENTQVVVLSGADLHRLNQAQCVRNEKLWKIYWWGGRRDEALIRAIERSPKLAELSSTVKGVNLTFGQGFKVANNAKDADWLERYQELPVSSLHRYGELDLSLLRTVPKKVERRGVEAVYSGQRLLVRRGIPVGGKLTIRLAESSFAFRNSIHGVRLQGLAPWQQQMLLGIFWSSLAQYFYWLTSGSWGAWHDEIHLDDVGAMPIKLTDEETLRERIGRIVHDLQALDAEQELELAAQEGRQRLPELERELDEAIFDLYDLGKDERDLVREMCAFGLDLFYNRQAGDAVREVELPSIDHGTIADVATSDEGFAAYLRVLLQQWNRELRRHGEFAWRVFTPASGAPILALLLQPRSHSTARESFDSDSQKAWKDALKRIASSTSAPAGSRHVLVDTFFRHVSEDEVLIIKRNERRFWTKTAAREDAEATLLQSMILSEQACA